MSASRSSAQDRRRQAGRDALLITLALLVAALAVGGGFALTRGVKLPFGLPSLGSSSPPTPVSTLSPLDAIAQIHAAYPAAKASLNSPLLDETDLTTINSSVQALSPEQATEVLELYLRGFSSQSHWQWIDRQPSIGVTTTYQVQATQLRVTLGVAGKPCTFSANVFTLTPTQIIQRGVTGKSYNGSGVASQADNGTPPAGAANC